MCVLVLYCIRGDSVSGSNKAMVIDMSAFAACSGKSKRVFVEGRDFYSLSYRYRGKVLIKTPTDELVSGEKSITFMPKGIGYETEILEDADMAIIHFKLNYDINFCNPKVLLADDEWIQLLFEKLIKNFRVDTPIDFSSMSIFYDLLSRLEAHYGNGEREYIPKAVRLAHECILREFSDTQLSISSIADKLGVSASYLRREFASVYKKSPIAFLRDIRIGNAKILLQSEFLSIEQIAMRCGFTSSSYFIQVFHKFVGDSPDSYRRKNHS